jgi:cytochrome c peroxidase
MSKMEDRSAMTPTRLGLAAVLTIAFACSSGNGGGTASSAANPPGGPPADAGAPPPDAGNPPADAGTPPDAGTPGPAANNDPVVQNATQMIQDGRQTFRFDTFGDEAFWGDTLHLHQAIEGSQNGGVGPGVSPKTALAVGLKVDVDALPKDVVDAVKAGKVNLDDPATTITLLKANAVVGVTGFFNQNSSTTLRSIGIQCALCHSTVDDSFAPGIGHRLDGWPNRDLNVGAIVALSPNLQPVADLLGVSVDTVRQVLASWGPGKFDAELFLDGKAFQPNGKSAATLIPAALGLSGVNLHTYTGWGSVPYWNAFVAVLEMHGQGNFFDPRLDDASKFPVAAKAKFGHVHVDTDLVTSKLAALHDYQLSLPVPQPDNNAFDHDAAKRGQQLFAGAAKCAQCHVPPLYTEPGWNMHTGAEIGIDDFQANRAPDGRYRTTPLRGLFIRAKGGFYHDGRFATLMDVVNHYDSVQSLGLTAPQKSDLVEFLKSL